MYEPYFGLPLEMMKQGRHAEARRRLYETALNSANSVITRREALPDLTDRARYELADRELRIALLERGPIKNEFFATLLRRVKRAEVALKGSAYSTYYEEKNEAFSTEPSPDWNAKQHSVRNTLFERRPQNVLDLGSNTGWFSILAARLGANVVAVDLDEASIDALYATAKRESLSILPLVVNLAEPVADRAAFDFPDEPSLSKIGGNAPLYPSPTTRLRCDMVMALAIVHHLVLGQGLSFKSVASVFDSLAKKYLCVEFVAIDDPMITSDRAFFRAYDSAPNSFSWYSLENFVAALRPHFPSVEVRPSHPGTRTIVVFSR
jgi:SAM-dependent methyltransferase